MANPLQDLISQQFLNTNPTAAFYRQFGGALGGQNQNYASWLKGQSDDEYNQYLGGLPSHPEQMFTDFLKGYDPMAKYQALSPSQRGQNPSQFQPRVRYSGGM